MKDFKTKNISEEQKPETKEAEKKLEKKTNIYSTGKYLCIIASAGVCFCLIKMCIRDSRITSVTRATMLFM